jgi:hypothetical protein
VAREVVPDPALDLGLDHARRLRVASGSRLERWSASPTRPEAYTSSSRRSSSVSRLSSFAASPQRGHGCAFAAASWSSSIAQMRSLGLTFASLDVAIASR